MSPREGLARLFEAVIERQESAFDSFRSTNDRVHRFSRSMLEGARQGAHDWTTVGRTWAGNPTDVVGLYESVSETIANGQARQLALWQEFLEDLAESQRESREVIRRSFGEVREAVVRVQETVERVQENVPSFLRSRVQNLRRNPAEPARKS